MSAKTFRGWPADAFDFYQGLEADNSKAYWQANKSRYEDAVRAPFEALLTDLETSYGPFRLFRPYRDVRFAKDKSPYKTAAAASSETQGGAGLYVQLSASGLFVGSGYYHMAPDQLTRFREALDDDTRGEAIVAVCRALERRGHELAAHDELKTAPRGYAKDHPRIDYLRRKGLVAGRTFPVAAWMHTPRAEDRIVDVWRQQAPMNEWLDANVGPSELPPGDQEW
jgi:uncharacterized protein (TIGR02453 family)